MKISYNILLAFVGISSVMFSSCTYEKPSKRDTPTQGIERIMIDESYQMLMSSELITFMMKYPDALIVEKYVPEEEAIQYLLKDSVDLIMISRDLSSNEKSVFESKHIKVRTVEIATDAVCFIVNKNNPDSIITKAIMDNILKGKITKWSEVSTRNKNTLPIQVVLDNNRSANARFLKDSFIHDSKFPASISAAGSTLAIFDFVEAHPNAIGIVSNGWISDIDDSTCNALLSRIRLVAIQANSTAPAYFPYQGFIADGNYPYRRKLYMINTEGSNGLATGFTSYVAGNAGQLIVLKNGIVPAIVPSRTVKINTEN